MSQASLPQSSPLSRLASISHTKSRDINYHPRRNRNLSDAPLLGSPSISAFSWTDSDTSSSKENETDIELSKDGLFCGIFRGSTFHKKSRNDRSKKSRDSIHPIPDQLRGIEEASEEGIDVHQFLKGEVRIETKQLGRKKRGAWKRLIVLLKRMIGKDVDDSHVQLRLPYNRRVRQLPRRLRKKFLTKSTTSAISNKQKNKKDLTRACPQGPTKSLVPDLTGQPGSKPTLPRYVPEISYFVNATDRINLDRIRDANMRSLKMSNDWRAQSDTYLASRGRRQINDEVIGKAPPISKRALEQDGFYIPLKTRPWYTGKPNVLQKKGTPARRFSCVEKSPGSAKDNEKTCGSAYLVLREDHTLSNKADDGVSRHTMFLMPNASAHPSRHLSAPEVRSTLRSGGVIIHSIHGLSFSPPRNINPTDDEGISFSDESASELHHRLSLKSAKRNKETVGVNEATQPRNGMSKDEVRRLSFNVEADPNLERAELNCKLKTKSRKLSVSIISRPIVIYGVSSPAASSTEKPEYGPSQSKSSRDPLPVAPSPTLISRSTMSRSSVTPGIFSVTHFEEDGVSNSDELCREFSSSTSIMATATAPQCCMSAFLQHDSSYSLSRRPSTYDGKHQGDTEEESKKTYSLLQSNLGSGWQHDLPSSPILSESYSQAAMTRRRDKKATVPVAVPEKQQEADHQNIEETPREANYVDSTKQHEISRIEPIGGARAKLIRWSTRRKTGSSARRCTIEEEHIIQGEDSSCEPAGVKPSVGAATSARGAANQVYRVHGPYPQSSNLNESREDVQSNLDTSLLPFLLNKQTDTESPLLDPRRSEDSVFTPTSPLQDWLESHDYPYQGTGLQRRHTRNRINYTTTSHQFVWSKKLKRTTSELGNHSKKVSETSPSEFIRTHRASGNTSETRGQSRWNSVSQPKHESATPSEDLRPSFLNALLHSEAPLEPNLKSALEAEAALPRKVTFATLPKPMEGRLQVRQPESGSHKAKAVDDARQAQAAVNEMCRLAGRPPPRWALCELIGKGSYGRVYMGKDMVTAEVVAIKTIDIDESDRSDPRHLDSFADWVKEVNALKSLKEINAKNVNHVIAAEPVGTVMWLVTEHCAGGSVQTLMKPTAAPGGPGGLLEKWIIPILREAAEGLKWVHQAGLIHRDIKCANVLVQEDGGVQLCDFGVAGVVENRFDKRSTIVGTPHWMAPELLKSQGPYGKEVDIWAFGAMAFELATGYPPSVAKGHYDIADLRRYLDQEVPRLEGGNFSDGLRDIVAYLLEEEPEQRPKIEQVQQHPYIANTESQYPTSSLSQLVVAFKQWVDHGGTRKSLFQPGGAQRKEIDFSSDPGGTDSEDWNFSTTQAFDNRVSKRIDPRDVFEAYGDKVVEFDTARPKVSRRRPPPRALAPQVNPLMKIFDPNTQSNYLPNSKNHYLPLPEQYMAQGPPTSDLPLRDDTARLQIKDTMIDLGGNDMDSGLSSFTDMDTLKAGNPRTAEDDGYTSNHQDFHKAPSSDPADINPNRRTQDWKFPAFAPPASADAEISRFPPSSYELPRPVITPGAGGRPALVHHPTEPLGGIFGGGLLAAGPSLDRRSMAESLIDLDMGMPDPYPEIVRPSTANSEAGSATSEQMPSGNPFEFERHVSYQSSIYVEDTRIDLDGSRVSRIDLDDARVSRINLDDALAPRLDIDETRLTRIDLDLARVSRIDLDEARISRIDMDAAMTPPRDINDISDFSEVESGPNGPGSDPNEASRYDSHGFSDSDYISLPPTKAANMNTVYTIAHFPVLPNPPSAAALAGTASREEMVDELSRSLGSMTAQLEAFRDVYESPAVTRSHSRRK